MERGLELLRSLPASGFTIRATRKLAVGYARTFQPRRALELLADAHEMATKIGALDQIHKAERIAVRLRNLTVGRRRSVGL